MRSFLLFFTIILFAASCKERCAECHIHDASGNKSNEFEICDKNKKDYNKAISAAESDGFECHERLE